MKIVFVGGGTAGHFYPLIAVAEKIKNIAIEAKLVEPDIYYFGEKNYNPSMLTEHNIKYRSVMSGKNRMYFSFKNILDFFKIFFGIIIAFFKLLWVYPDVIFSKGGYDSLPTCIAAFILRIPIVMHDSDAIPGRVSLFVSRFANRIALSYPSAIDYFSEKAKNIIAVTGQPILEKYTPEKNFIKDFLDKNLKERRNILIAGGSSGSVKINDAVLEILPELCSKYNVIHQTGQDNIDDIKVRSSVILENYNKNAYAPYASLDFSKVYSQIDLVISRAGSSMFEFAAWQIPSIIIPISPEVSRDQTKNAEETEKAEFIKVIAESNLSPHILLNEINSILENKILYSQMSLNAKKYANLDASKLIAKEIVNIIASHR